MTKGRVQYGWEEKSAFFFFFEVGKGQLSQGGRNEIVHLQCRDRAVLGKSTCGNWFSESAHVSIPLFKSSWTPDRQTPVWTRDDGYLYRICPWLA